MTSFVNDTTEKQIERGELFFAEAYSTSMASGASYSWGIETNSYPCKVGMEIIFPETCTLWIYEGVTTAFGADTIYNLNRNSAKTLDADWDKSMSTTAVGGTTIFEVISPHGEVPMNTPFHRETGIILDDGTRYQFKIRNDGGSPADFTIYTLLRDLT